MDDFREYVAVRGPGLLRSAVLLTGDRGHAEDLVQTALIRVHARWGRIRDREAVDAYVRRAMLTTYLNWWRRRWRGEVPTEVLPDRAEAGGYERVETRLPLAQALTRLPPRMRAVVVLRYFDDLPDAEIAALLGCSAATVRSQAHRALAKLREDGALADLAPTERRTER
jgi:RNA polymerase sigma-70 factor (sigma-E family)